MLLERQEQPVLIVLENLHHCTPEILRRFKHMLGAFNDLPVMWLCTYRDDEYPALERRLTTATSVHLPRLVRSEIEQLCLSLLGTETANPHVLHILERETGGNPFLIVETVRALAEKAGSLASVQHMTLPARVSTPSTTELVQRRLQYIPHAQRELLPPRPLTDAYLI